MRQDKYDKIVAYIIENQDKFYRLAFTYVQNKDDALDIVQNSICKALENYDSIRNIEYVKTWFYRVLVNESINFIKKGNKEVSSEALIIENTPYIESSFEKREDVFEEINKLPINTQNVIKLRYYEEMSLQEISQITKVNINTVKARLYRGLKMLKKEVTI